MSIVLPTSPLQKKKQKLDMDEGGEAQTTDTGTPVRYLPLESVYTATETGTSGSSMSKKIKARKLIPRDSTTPPLTLSNNSSIRFVYARRSNKVQTPCPSYFDSLLERFGSQFHAPSPQFETPTSQIETPDKKARVLDDPAHKPGGSAEITATGSKKQKRNSELLKLGVDSELSLLDFSLPRRRSSSAVDGSSSVKSAEKTRKRKVSSSKVCQDPDLLNASASASDDTSLKVKKWVELSFEDVDPNTFVGLECKVFWPLDDDWYTGSVIRYDLEMHKHHVQYTDGDSESLILSKEKIKFYLSREEMQQLNLRYGPSNKDDIGLDFGEMLVLAASCDECDELEPGDIIWAKLTGYAVWPAVVLNESDIGVRKGLKSNQGERSVPVQFFGTYDFARINVKQVISFLKGLLASYHLKCKQSRFRRSLEEAKMYLSEQKLPNKMLQLQNGTGAEDSESESEDEGSDSSGENPTGNESARARCINTCPFEVGNLRVVSLGRVVIDSEYFHDERYIWPEGYAAVRKFISVTDPNVNALYKMEVLRDPDSKFRPLFRVTMDNEDQFQGSNPAACWNKIYRRIRKLQSTTANGCHAGDGLNKIGKSGSYMFGFSNPKVLKLIQDLSLYSGMPSMYSGCKVGSKRGRELTAGYRPVRVEWKDLDKCNVCHMDEEYANNLFLQCDKCRMMVHARCYGELEPVNGVLWLCNLCRLGALESPPPCCLCPVIGGAMKPTTNGLWAHLACAIWIPETCFLDIKRMEPIDGLNRISKDRWKLLCSICGVSYGACIQCSNSTCRVAYHPLCARAAGLCVELEDEDRLHLMSFDEDEEDQCIRLLSFCKKHRPPSNERPPGEHVGRVARCFSNYSPPLNASGCARTEPYDFVGRRGRKEPEALAAASLKRLYVENRPYLVTGYRQNWTMENELGLSKSSTSFRKSNLSLLETSKTVLSMAEKYDYMRQTFRKRLAFGKSGIHGFGIFAKLPHRAGDMMIEYSGEVVRPSIADRREHFIYNSLVGAGTYMFRIDDERVIDATRAGSIAHLINHSCEPNCYSRVIRVHGDEHIIIFAKRDINKWEELTYDYRFSSVDEQLACYCGFPRCRGVVNDIDTEEQAAKLRVPRSKLINWTSTSLQID